MPSTLLNIKPRYIVLGHKRHGKDFACEYLQKMYDMSFASSSRVACDLFIFDLMKENYGYASADECFEDRVNHRAFWYERICEFNDPDKAKLGKIIFGTNDIYCGIRDREEFYALKAAKQFDLAIWIDAHKRLPAEDSSSMKLCAKDADIIVDNNGSEAQLFETLDKLYRNVLCKEKNELLNANLICNAGLTI